jgi:transcription antitermination factor NusG
MHPTIALNTSEDHWFVLYVKPRHEKYVSTILQGKGYEEFLPLYTKLTRSRASELPLFPGYVFCRFNLSRRLPVLTVPGVFSIVGFAGTPIPVNENEITALRQVVANGLPREPWPDLPSGSPVTISQGPMRGVQGVVVRHKNSLRVIISVTVLQRSVAVEVERDWLDQSASATAA